MSVIPVNTADQRRAAIPPPVPNSGDTRRPLPLAPRRASRVVTASGLPPPRVAVTVTSLVRADNPGGLCSHRDPLNDFARRLHTLRTARIKLRCSEKKFHKIMGIASEKIIK